jgi:two-component system, OmpR family, response regulator
MARILVVDDEPRIVSFVGRALAAEGYGIDPAYDGEHALRLARTGLYDLVLLDLRLPDTHGTNVLRTMVSEQPDQPVVILSEVSDVNEKVRCFSLGACDYLVKPFALAELVARVGLRLKDRHRTPEGETRAAGGMRLDARTRTVDAGRGPVHLSDREFRVLDHLTQRAGQVCTREEILSEVWGYWFDPNSNLVDVMVGRLRNKIGSSFIETVRNVGYRIIES